MPYSSDDRVYTIVLAAGEGSRLGSITVDSAGRHVPKQFCSLYGGATLLQATLARARCVSDPEHTFVVLAVDHRQFWARLDLEVPQRNFLCQPCNRGTANGLLLPLVAILQRDPEARVLVLPADHHVRREGVLRGALRAAVRSAWRMKDRVLMLGMEPELADPDLGYILPQAGTADEDGVEAISAFFEKPSRPCSQALIARGALWNAFILAAPARALLAMFQRRLPGHVHGFQSLGEALAEPWALAHYYSTLASRDFSRDVVPGNEALLRLQRVARCGWSDLGTPGRLVSVLHRRPLPERAAGTVFIDLSSRVAEARRSGCPGARGPAAPATRSTA